MRTDVFTKPFDDATHAARTIAMNHTVMHLHIRTHDTPHTPTVPRLSNRKHTHQFSV